MTVALETPLPETIDGEPDFAAEIARLNADLKTIAADVQAAEAATDMDALNRQLEELISEQGRANLPTTGSKMDQVFARITAALAEQKIKPVVPETDAKRPSLTPTAVDFTTLPVHARIAAGYGKA